MTTIIQSVDCKEEIDGSAFFSNPQKAYEQTKEKSEEVNFSDNSEYQNIDANGNVSAKVQKVINSIPEYKQDCIKKILNKDECKELLSKSKTSMKILSLPSEDYEVELNKCDNEVVLVYKCKHGSCRKEFNKSQNFVVHMKTHMGIKKFKCKYCSLSFSQKGNMQKHYKLHKYPLLPERKKVKCGYCGTLFTEKYNCQLIRDSEIAFHGDFLGAKREIAVKGISGSRKCYIPS